MLAAGTMFSAPVRAQSKLAGSGWPAFRNNAPMTAFTPARGPVLPEVKWQARFGSGQLGSPVVGIDGTIYVSGNADSALYAIAAADGSLKWIFAGKAGEKIIAPAVVGQDGAIYFGSKASIFYALNPNGTERWRVTLGGAIHFSANIGSDGTIYVVAQDCRLYAISPAGKIKWQVSLLRFPGNGPAVATDDVIYVVAGEFLDAFNPADGSRRPNFPVNCVGIGILNGLMVEGKELIYVTSQQNPRIWAISHSGVLRWDFRLPAGFGNPTMPALGKDGVIYFGGSINGSVFALKHDGFGLRQPPFSRPGSKNLSELFVDDSSYVYIVNDTEGLLSISAAGKFRWSVPEVKGAFSPAIGADGVIFVAGNRTLFAVWPQPPRAASLLKISGDRQTGCIESALAAPIVVLVKDQYGVPFPNHPVRFRARAGGSPIDATVLTDANGLAQVFWTLGPLPGTQEIEAFSENAGTPLNGSPVIFTAAVIAPIISGAGEVVFDSTETKSASEKVYVIHNNSTCSLRIDSVRIFDDAHPSFSVRAPQFPQVIPPGDSLPVRAQFSPPDCGSHLATLRFFSNDAAHSPFNVTLRGAALLQPNIEVANNLIDFATICPGTSATLPLPIFNFGCADLIIANVVSSNSAFRVAPTSLVVPPGGQATLQVIFSPTALIPYIGALAISGNDRDENPVVVNVKGIGGAADIDGARAVIFDRVDLQLCAGITNADTAMYVIHNLGVCDLNIKALIPSGDFSVIAPSVPAAVPIGDSLKVTLRFAPQTIGSHTETLKIQSDDPDEPEFGVTLRGSAQAAPDIAAPLVVDFGAVPIGGSKGLPVAIKNLGAEKLEVTRFATSPRVFTTAAPGFELACNETKNIEVVFTPTDSNVVEGTLEIFSNDPNENPFVVKLRGTGFHPKIKVAPLVLNFGAVCGDSLLPVVVMNIGQSPFLRVDKLVFSNPAFSTDRKTPFNLPVGGSERVLIRFSPTIGQVDTGTVSIFNTDPNSNPIVVRLRGEGEVPNLAGSPNPVNFGAVEVQICAGKFNSATRQYAIRNEGACDLVIDALIAAAPFSVISPSAPFIVPGRSSAVVTLKFAPADSGDFAGTLRIVSNDPDEPSDTVSLIGRGLFQPDIEVKPDSLNFGAVSLGSNKSLPLTIKNVGALTLVVNNLRISSPAFKIEASEFVLECNDSSVVTVAFTPTSTGVFADILEIFSNDTDENPTVVKLRGFGLAPDIAVMPNTLEFGLVCGGTDKALFVTVKNEGDDTLRVRSLNSPNQAFSPEHAPIFNLAPGASEKVAVRFTAVAGREDNGTLSISSNDPDEPAVSVVLHGKGIASDIALAATPPTFGQICLGAVASTEVCIFNPSDCVLRVDSLDVGFTGTALLKAPKEVLATAAAANPILINPKEKFCFTVRTTPLHVGNFQARVTVWSNAPNKSPLSIVISGAVVAADIAGASRVDFDTVEVQICAGKNNSSTRQYLISNTGLCDLVIDSLVTAAPFSVASPATPLTLPPGGSVEVELRFMPTTSGTFPGTLRIVSNDPDESPLLVALRGTGASLPDIAVEPTTLNFGDVPVGNNKSLQLKIANIGAAALRVDRLESSCPQFKTEAGEFILECGKDSSVTVAFSPTAAGLIECTLSIYSNDPNENPVKVTLRGNGIVPDIAVNPTRIDFGTRCNSADSIMSISNQGPAPLIVAALNFLNANSAFSIDPKDGFTLNSGDSKEIKITYTPVRGRPGIDTLSIVSNDPDENPLKVPLQGLGGQQDIAVDSTQVNFPTVTVTACSGTMSFADQMLVIRNAGTCDLVIGSLLTSGVFSVISPNTPQTVLPGTSLQVTLRFMPDTSKKFTGTLRIVSNDPDESPLSIDLSGEGKFLPDIEVAPLTLDFGPVAVGTSRSLMLKISSRGAVTLQVDSLVNALKIFTVSSRQFGLECGKDSLLTVTFKPTASGVVVDALLIYSNDPDENPVKVILRGDGTTPDIAVNPTTNIDFGTLCGAANFSITISNQGPAPLIVTDLKFSNTNSAFSIDPSVPLPFTLNSGDSKKITIRYTPVRGRPDTDTLSIVSNDPDENPFKVTLLGNGGVPDIDGLKTVDFGTVKVTCAGPDTMPTRTYVIHNVGVCDLQIDMLTVTGAFSILSGGGRQTIKPGERANVELQFKLSSEGTFKGVLQIKSDDPDEALFNVDLSGVGMAAPPDIKVAPLSLDFGSVPVGSDTSLTFKVSSLGGLVLEVNSLISSAPQFATLTTSLRLACGKDSIVTVTFTPDSVGDFSGELTLKSNDPDSGTIKIKLKGRGESPIRVKSLTDNRPDSLIFNKQVCLGDSASLNVEIHNSSSFRWSSSSIKAQPRQFTIVPDSLSIPAGQRDTIRVSFKPDKIGVVNGALTIAWAPVSRPPLTLKLPPLRIPLSGEGIAPQISGAPEVIFPNTEIDSTTTRAYTVFNNSKCELRLDVLKITGTDEDDFDYVPIPLPRIIPAGDSLKLTLRFTPSDSGAREADLNIWNNDPNKNPFVVKLRGRGILEPPKIATDSLLYRFALLCADSVGRVNVIVTNVGGDTLKVDSVRVQPNDGIFSAPDASFSLASGESDTLVVTFKPTSGGPFEATLKFFSNATNNNAENGKAYEVKLKGNSGAPKIDGFIAVKFDSTKVGTTLRNFYFVSNLGDCPLRIDAMSITGTNASDFKVRGFLPPVIIPPDDSRRFTLEFTPSHIGQKIATLLIENSDPQKRIYSVELSGKGLSSQASPPPDSTALGKVCACDSSGEAITNEVLCVEMPKLLDFGEVFGEGAKHEKLAVKNCNTRGTLIVEVLQRAGNGRFKAAPAMLEIDPDNTQWLDVEFGPAHQGRYEDTLRLVYYAPTAVGKKDSVTIVLRGAVAGRSVYALPNAFTPNDDDRNDRAKIHFTGIDPSTVALRIYDLRGMELCHFTAGEVEREARGFFISWNGRDAGGRLQLPGAYLWLLEENGKRAGSGQVVLIR